MDDFLLRKASREQVRHIVTTFMAVQFYAAGDVHVAQSFRILLREKDLSPLFLNGSPFMQSVLAKKKTAAKSSLPQTVSTTTEALRYFQATGYANSCVQNRRLYAKLHWKSGSRIGAAAQLMTGKWSALSRSNDLENPQTAYWLYFIYQSRTAFPHVVTSRTNCFSRRSHPESLDRMERPVKTEDKIDQAA